ncbi:hypothetical protein [Mucilaginibacter sp. KACC 22063]|uniref:hypothetical protein n=1 Tax=Mucilaginibacter sp. KACC 22063 TaxID=3025666 RepID=UPI00236638F3|nr:hypothetical protein [Mucilaginibacter sp. KACC 22063]WDF55523.1 hypothetical protein PQ461_00430 [Mucilaginibacter sp. KACC 22063]
MKKAICLIALGAISFGSVMAYPATVKTAIATDTTKVKVKKKATKTKVKKKVAKDTTSKM